MLRSRFKTATAQNKTGIACTLSNTAAHSIQHTPRSLASHKAMMFVLPHLQHAAGQQPTVPADDGCFLLCLQLRNQRDMMVSPFLECCIRTCEQDGNTKAPTQGHTSCCCSNNKISRNQSRLQLHTPPPRTQLPSARPSADMHCSCSSLLGASTAPLLRWYSCSAAQALQYSDGQRTSPLQQAKQATPAPPTLLPRCTWRVQLLLHPARLPGL